MHVLVTGASGHVGTNLIPKLVSAGHSVTALVRSQQSAEAVKKNGATEVILGSIGDKSTMQSAASKVDAVIHLAFNHDIMHLPGGAVKACEDDRTTIQTICDALLASGPSSTGKAKIFIGTSGTLGNLGPDEKCGKEENPHLPRYLSDNLTYAYGDKGLRTAVVRLPPVVHGPHNEHPFITAQITAAKEHGYAGYLGDGTSVWPSVHVKDAATLYTLALDKAPNKSNLHAVAEGGITKLEIADKIASKLGFKTQEVKQEDAIQLFGWVGPLLSLDNPTTADLTRTWLGWDPVEYGLLEELNGYTY